MKSIPNIKLSEKEFKYLITECRVGFGGEATICEGSRDYTLYKLFSKFHEPKPMGENKEKKIIELYNRQIDYSVKPLSTVSVGDMIVGYEMLDEIDLENADLCLLPKEQLIYFLKETKRILEYFSNKGIIYADIEPRNILFNKESGRIIFCDMDNTQVDDLPIDLLPTSLLDYQLSRGIDNGVHSYMHNRMTLRAFDLDMFCSGNYALRREFKRPGRKIIESMKEPVNFKDEFIIEHIKKYK